MNASSFNLSALAVRERAVTLFLLIALVGAGFFAFEKLGRAEDPTFAVKTMVVSAAWPGANSNSTRCSGRSPTRWRKRLQELVYYDRVETTVRPGLMLMKVIFKDNMPPAKLPSEFYYQPGRSSPTRPPACPAACSAPCSTTSSRTSTSPSTALQAQGLPHRALVLRAEDLRQRLLRVPGVEKINILGEQAQKIFVEISYQRLATLASSPASSSWRRSPTRTT